MCQNEPKTQPIGDTGGASGVRVDTVDPAVTAVHCSQAEQVQSK